MKRVVPYSRKKFRATLFVLTLVTIFSVFQIIMTWLQPFIFSWHLIPIESLPGNENTKIISLKIVSMAIEIIVLLIVVLLGIKSKKSLDRKVYMSSWINGLVLVIATFILFFLIPSATPVNYLLPIVVLFWYVVSLF
ncbi:hypothetical protein MYMA111404_01980 [Mycoplasma marinum]|uniref:Uncharacterized protein n=1 Tax=Mycoplasma marinum TaxID=1937190 RepID=A0A4R0XMZ2_9MOLU|nr:hypothetical protein [Mycoplasma marinum]TCG11920.1 hypothetical protein C4B24_00795 [Mycoplasma marinum]